MSGLVAILNRAGQPADSSLLTRMLAAAPHRGPDGFGGWFEGPVALGSAQLHSTPESLGERQPLSDKAAETWIVCDGRLDNRAELMAALGDALPDPETASDAACIAAAYGRWGEGCPSRLLGDFAFAIWDRRRRHLFCARDLVGIRPLYYRLTETSFYAASETRQLLNVPDAALRPNVGMMAEYLSGRLLSVEETLHDGILRLPAGHSLTVTSETIRVRRYDEIKLTRIRLRNDQEYAEAFLSHFREAVACRMRSHTAIGVTVSGGLDSSSVFGMACRLAGDQPGVRAYALTSTTPAADERRYLDDVLARWPVPAHTVSCDDWDGPTTLEQCAMRRDVPDLPNGAPWSILYQAAQRDGVRVMLGGDGGDEWLSGSLWHQADLLRTLRLFSLWKDCRATGWSFDHAILPLIPRPLKRLARRCVPEPLPPWIDPGFAARVGLRDRWQRRPTIRPSTCAQRDLLSALDSGWYALQHELTNRLEAERGIEGRSPFYDRRLIEFALALPDEQRRRGTVLKLVLRRAMGDLVPKSIRLRRTKAEFSHLYRHAIEREGPEARLSSLRLADVGCLSMPAVRQLYADYRRGTADPHALWMIFAIDAWYRTLFT